jgi:hypothetical protein
VVVVTAEYRLGVLGFLANSLLTAERVGSSGDYALLDMIAALSWVKQNIANFGGDPNHVMLFGQSAGSFDIQMLLASPAAQGMFSAAGMESNVIPSASTAPWVPTLAVAEAASVPFVDAMGCGGAADVLACMRAVPAETLVNAYFQSPVTLGPGLGSTFLPMDSFVFLQQHGSPVPLLIGSTREEWTGVTDRPVVPLTESQYETALHTRFDSIGPTIASQVLSHETWTPVPLWIAMKTPTIRTSSAAAALTKMFLKEVKSAEQNNAGPPAGQEEQKGATNIPSQDGRTEETVTPSDEKTVSLPVEILQAKKAMVMLRIDPVAGSQGERKEKDVEKEIQKWGRFSLVADPSGADLLIVCVRFMVSGARASDSHTYENLLIFRAGGKTPDWSRMPLWTAMQIETIFGPAAGTQMVRWLRKQIESQGTPAN